MAEWLNNHNYEVRVITANPYFPEWEVKKNVYKKETINSIQIQRCILWVPKNPTGIKRILHLISFTVTSFPFLMKEIFWKPDVIFTIAPSFFCSPCSILFSKLCGPKVLNWIHFQDLELDAAFKLGLLNSKILKKIGKILEIYILKNFCIVSTISNSMMKNLSQKGVNNKELFLLPNWVDINEIRPIKKSKIKNIYTKRLKIKENQIVLLYSGSINKKQGIGIISKLIENLDYRLDLFWIIAGAGSSYGQIKKFCKSKKNTICLPLQPRKELNDFLNIADIHLIPQKKEATDLVMPSKLLPILSSGKSFIASSTKESELGKIAEKVGLRVDPEDIQQFKDAIEKLADNKDLRDELGKKARKYVKSNFEKNKVLKSLNQKILFEASLRKNPFK